jgi:oxygen-dependent protoporphyrinogen oxidase
VTDHTKQHDVLVVGGGISGLVTAWRIKEAGVDVGLIEAADGVGGAMRSEHRDGFILEKGPFNVLVRDDVFHDLLDACGDEVKPITAADEANARFVLKGGVLQKVPTGPGPLIPSPLLSFGAKLRALTGMFISRRADLEEPTIDQAAERRLGREVADVFISSIVAGIFGGDSRKLSLKACFPNAWRFDQDCRSPLLYELKVLREKKRKAKADPRRAARKGLISFDGGLQSLPDWLARQLGDGLVTNCRIESIERTPEGFTLRGREAGDERTFTCRRLVLATPKQSTAELLRPHAPDASAALDEIDCASLVVLNLAYREADVGHPMQGYGFLVPATEDSPIMGVLWADSAFPHHAPDRMRLIRVFMGGPRDPQAPRRSGEELLTIATDAIRGLLDITGEPTLTDVCSWPDAIPQYHVGHTERVERIRTAMAPLPRLHLVGSYLTGVSINDCVRDAADAATRIVSEISADVATMANDSICPAELNGFGRDAEQFDPMHSSDERDERTMR